MTGSMKAAMAASVVGAFALGIWIAPHVRETTPEAPVEQVAIESPAVTRVTPAARSTAAVDVSEPAVTLEASAPPVQKHVKSVLTWGTDPEKAAEGFTSAEQFVAVAHAAKNTEVPFMLLKHRVLNEKQSLEAAIRALQPDLDASLEADRARLEARAHLSRMNE